ncbi:hypothetical protein [Spiroplasma endosymbiont of Atherix ibis]|uniref:hypothetical protein n=1 Tax=Spiroplasma endosymbiont of Atherix ibis TaxID=3066291 RepID=UPI0030CDFDE7
MTNTQHNHTTYIIFEESCENNNIKNFIYKSSFIQDVSYIKNNVYFNKNGIILKNLKYHDTLNNQLDRLEKVIKIWPWFLTIIWNCIFNETWKIKNEFNPN